MAVTEAETNAQNKLFLPLLVFFDKTFFPRSATLYRLETPAVIRSGFVPLRFANQFCGSQKNRFSQLEKSPLSTPHQQHLALDLCLTSSRWWRQKSSLGAFSVDTSSVRSKINLSTRTHRHTHETDFTGFPQVFMMMTGGHLQ